VIVDLRFLVMRNLLTLGRACDQVDQRVMVLVIANPAILAVRALKGVMNVRGGACGSRPEGRKLGGGGDLFGLGVERK